MRTHNNNIGKITAKTLPKIFNWLEKIMFLLMKFMLVNLGIGNDGFYIDDR